MKDQTIKMNLMKNKNRKSKKQLIEHVFLKIYLLGLIILILFVPYVNFTNNYNSEQFNNPLYVIDCQENLKTSDPGPLLSFYSFQIDDDNSGSSQGDSDGNIDAGETIELRLTLENTGDEDALDVNATLSSLNNNITITNGFQDFITLPQNSTGMSSSFFVFKINSSCPADYYITIDIEIEASNEGPWADSFQILVVGNGNPVFQTYSVYSEASGDLLADNDGIVDPGEIIVFDMTVKNLAGANVYGVNGLIATSDPYTTINDNSGSFGDINSNGGTKTGRFGITVSGACPDKHQINFNLNLTDNEGTRWYLSFYLIINGTSDYEIFDFQILEVEGDGDDNVDAGEEWYSNITIRNIGEAIGHDVWVFFDSSDPYISFDSPKNNFSFGNVNVNTTISHCVETEYDFTVSDTTPSGHTITFNIQIMDNSGYEHYFYKNVTVNGITDYEIFDFQILEVEGDGDDNVDAGEEWYSNITIRNIGEAIGHDVWVFFDSSDPYISFDSPKNNFSFGNVNVNTTISHCVETEYDFTVSDTTPANHILSFNIRITDNSGFTKEFIVHITIVEGGTVEPNIEDILSDIDWGMVGILALVISCVVGLIGFFYANSHYNWNIGTKIKNKKQRKKNARELEGNKFENLIRKSKDLVDKSQQYYSKESFLTAVDSWKDAVNYYILALKKAPSSEVKTTIKDSIRILRENIYNAYVENGKKHNLTAKKAHKEENIQKAQKEWNSAKNDFQMAIDIIKSEKLEISYEQIEFIIKSIELNLSQLEIEKSCLDADTKLQEARSLQNKDLKEATLLSQNSFLQYSEAKSQAEKYPEFQELFRRIQTKMQNTRNFQLELQDKMDELIGITPLTTKVIIDDVGETGYDKVGTIIKAEKREKALSIIREYEFIGGQIRFKIALINNTRNPLTNFKISFDIPDALKWIMHEPNYERKGDSVLMSKVGINEKKTVSLYLEPINCIESHINATVSFFDAKDRPQAVPMNPKMISLTCPIFFTESEANLARVKSLQRKLNHRDRKIFPIINPEKVSLIFSSVLSVFGKYDIKLVFKEFSEKDKFGEAWFYGITKVKKNRLVMYILLDGENKTLELEVSGDNEEQITAFLAEIGNQIRQQLIKHNVITSDDKFYDIRISVLSNECPYCGGRISPEDVQNYQNGESIKCKYCDQLIINIK